MLIKINDRQWIESKDIYLIDNDPFNENEIMVYINQHPKIPVIIKGEKDIKVFTQKVNKLLKEEKSHGTSIPEDEQETG